ncbi:MAG: hypothetical protein ACQEVA_20245 [Myxococcota bacterium]
MSMLPLALFVAVPIVVLTAALIFFISSGRQEERSATAEPEASESGPSPKPLWIVSGVLSLVFVAVGFPKVGDAEMVLTSFEKWGYPEHPKSS